VGDTAATRTSNTTGSFIYATLFDGRYAFACSAADQAGLRDLSPVTDTFQVLGATTRTFSDTGAWFMLGVPAKGIAVDSLKANGYLSYWDESIARKDIYGYYVQGDEIDHILPATAYWRKAARPLTVRLDAGNILSTPCSLSLVAGEFGWNQISSPYPYPVKWSKGGALWRYDLKVKDYVEVVDSALNPWEGYWYMADSTETVVLQPSPYFAGTKLAKRAKTFFVDRSEWRIQFVLTSGVNRDAENLIGFSPLAQNGHDALDRAEPPRIGDYPYMFVAHPEWKRGVSEYASDIRQTFNLDKNVFQIGIAPIASEAGEVTLKAMGLQNLSEIYVFMGDQHGVSELLPDSAYHVGPCGETTYRSVFVSADKDFLSRMPLAFRFGAPYPNPFGPRVNLRYTLPYRWEQNGWFNTEPYEVRMEIFDARGRRISTLVNQAQEPGHYMAVWNGMNGAGSRVATGAYFCRLTAGKFKGVSRMVLLR
jgi:hypothetical protein